MLIQCKNCGFVFEIARGRIYLATPKNCFDGTKSHIYIRKCPSDQEVIYLDRDTYSDIKYLLKNYDVSLVDNISLRYGIPKY